MSALATKAATHAAGRKVWVLGASGMLGHAVIQALAARGVAFVSSASDVDIAQPQAVESFAAAARADTWINCAAMTRVDDAEDGGLGAAANEAVNARGPGVLAAAARLHGARVVHVSTDYVFAGDAQAPYAEDAPCAPKSAYGRAKYQGEKNFWAELQGAEPATGYVVRTAWLFGPQGHNFVTTMLALMRSRPQLQVVNDQHGRPTYTVDLAAAILALVGLGSTAAESGAGDCAPAGTYHYANAGPTTWHGFATAILAEARRRDSTLACTEVAPTDSSKFVRPAPRPAYSVLATHKVSRATKLTPRPWEQALHSYFDVLATSTD